MQLKYGGLVNYQSSNLSGIVDVPKIYITHNR